MNRQDNMAKGLQGLRKIGLGILFFAMLFSCNTKNSAPKAPIDLRPNIIFIMADDLGVMDVGFNGSTYYETPVLDTLAQQSLVFENAYMYPTCSPSRAALLTGKQSFRTGVYGVPVLEKGTDKENIFSRWTVERKHQVYAQPLAEAGYSSVHIGKWHIVGPYPQKELGMDFPLKEKLTQPRPGDFSWVAEHKSDAVKPYYPEGRGFLKNVAGTFRGDPAFEEGGYKSKTGGYRAPFSNPFLEPKPGDEWLTDRLTDEALDFMAEHKERPFFVNLHYYTVHRPIKNRSQTLFDKYMAKKGDSITGQGVGERRETMASYATMIESLDQNIQRILNYLDENGLRQNTMLVFTSDNGYNGGQSSNNLLRGAKRDIYEGGIRVPALIHWPAKVRPRRTKTAISVLDFFPTFLDVANITDYHDVLDGNSLSAVFTDEDKFFEERPLFWHLASQISHGACSVIRKDDYKLIQFLADGTLELYNLAADPKETNNLAESEPKMTAALLQQLVQWRLKNNVPLPPNSTPEQ